MGKYEINHAKFVVRAVSARKNGNIYLRFIYGSGNILKFQKDVPRL